MSQSVDESTRTLAVVIPAYNAAATLPDCLAAISQSQRQPDEIIVFDDGSTDDTAEIARAAGAQVISSKRPCLGPAAGRNIGTAATKSDIVVFVDADVAVWPCALGALEQPLLTHEAVASFGSYDDRPRSRRPAALYANLRHHWVHQHGRDDAFTFWSGLGAMRRDVFQAHQGFDTRFRQPSIEDVELGSRIVASGGRIRLVKNALGTHCKDWGVLQLWRTDIFRRALPWARLIRAGRGSAHDLNISKQERASGVAALLLCPAAVAAILRPAWCIAAVLVLLAYLCVNARFFAFLFRRGGFVAGITGVFLHWCYHVYASVTFSFVMGGLVDLVVRSRGAEGSRRLG